MHLNDTHKNTMIGLVVEVGIDMQKLRFDPHYCHHTPKNTGGILYILL